jgi:hypothetical protein
MHCRDSAKFNTHRAMSSSAARYMTLWFKHYNVKSGQVHLDTPLLFFTLVPLYSGRLLNMCI